VNQRFISIVFAGLLALPAVAADLKEELTVGNPAPPFTLTGSDGREYSLSDFKDEEIVVLAWFPKAFTGG
jgi:peroxiredoxin Q/BCP